MMHPRGVEDDVSGCASRVIASAPSKFDESSAPHSQNLNRPKPVGEAPGTGPISAKAGRTARARIVREPIEAVARVPRERVPSPLDLP
jgi:hypothetical protein